MCADRALDRDGLLVFPFAVVTAAVLALFMDYSFLSMLFAVGFFLGKSGGGSEKPQWEIDKERWDAERQAKTAQERRINI